MTVVVVDMDGVQSPFISGALKGIEALQQVVGALGHQLEQLADDDTTVVEPQRRVSTEIDEAAPQPGRSTSPHQLVGDLVGVGLAGHEGAIDKQKRRAIHHAVDAAAPTMGPSTVPLSVGAIP